MWSDMALSTWERASNDGGTTLIFGNGRSYGDSCLASSGHVVQTLAMDRIISVDWHTGIFRAEAGITLDRIHALSIPRGWILPVTPGTEYATLAGAIANDVHGKNHHVRGTLGRHVRCFGLLRSDGTLRTCSDDSERPYFVATIGGLGLTGLIPWVELQLMPISSSEINATSIRFGNLEEFFELSEELDPTHEYSVAWVDCHRRGSGLGRGVFIVGNHAPTGPLEVAPNSKTRVPFALPFSPINRWTVKALNEVYFHKQIRRTKNFKTTYRKYFYPLDGLLDWNRLYGRSGFQQYQCVVPAPVAKDSIRALLSEVSNSGLGSILAVLKRCGSLRSPGILSFPIEGTSLALDFPVKDSLNSQLFERLDLIVHGAGGRIYPAKDSHQSGAHFRAAYPRWNELEAFRDPRLLSRFWKRTTQE